VTKWSLHDKTKHEQGPCVSVGP